MTDITERLAKSIKIYEMTGNGKIDHTDMMRDAKVEIEKLRDLIRKNWNGDCWRGVSHSDVDEVNEVLK